MLKTGILNPNLLSLMARVRHTNTLVIADRGFPSWPDVETIDLSLVDGIPTVLQVLAALRHECVFGEAYMANEFLTSNSHHTKTEFNTALNGIALIHEPHVMLKTRVPSSTGLIRTGDTIQYANVVLVSA